MSTWTKDEIKTLKKQYPSRPTIEVAETIGRTVESVKRKAARLGLKKSARQGRRS